MGRKYHPAFCVLLFIHARRMHAVHARTTSSLFRPIVVLPSSYIPTLTDNKSFFSLQSLQAPWSKGKATSASLQQPIYTQPPPFLISCYTLRNFFNSISNACGHRALLKPNSRSKPYFFQASKWPQLLNWVRKCCKTNCCQLCIKMHCVLFAYSSKLPAGKIVLDR